MESINVDLKEKRMNANEESGKSRQSSLDECVERAADILKDLEDAKQSGKTKYPFKFKKCVLKAGDIGRCIYMMEKYATDYKAMSLDPRNAFMDSESTLARKIRIFKETNEYQLYLMKKGET
ncbi:unnamed protein product [Dracunculus medinensis]|uniref:Nucleolar protein 16 n=1 Tax=Dracunculus medinensis TaxID=318479 RepID=A0A0N4U0E6_DRAME|nr:unnamed protein product [Dracunculus medinensis]